jgi:hypothetical protein
MARKKNKIEILDEILSLENSKKFDDWGWDMYWYDDYCYDYCYDLPDDCYDYRYSGTISVETISKRGGRITYDNFITGMYIDMSSIYSGTLLRDKKIEYLLDLGDYTTNKQPSIGDFFQKI